MRYNGDMHTNSLRIAVSVALFFGVVIAPSVLCMPLYAQVEESDAPSIVSDEEGVVSEEGDAVVEPRMEGGDLPDVVKTEVGAQEEPAQKAEGVTVLPVVANEKAKPRDIIKKELLLTNNTEQHVSVYITVSNIDPMSGDQIAVSPLEADLSTSLANWVEITRGVIELEAGESRKVPYLVHVNLSAKPAAYFARISFHQGQNRAKAEAAQAVAELILNLEVEDDANERLQLGGFMSEDPIVVSDVVNFSYMLENVGNRLVQPRGSIRIFNRRGEEVGSVPLNADGEEITPESRRELAAAWTASGRFGKYKAFLDLEYGEDQLASVQDTVYFWIFPWKEILVSLGGVLVLAIIGTYIVHMRAVARPMHAVVTVSEEHHSALDNHSPPPPPRIARVSRSVAQNSDAVLLSTHAPSIPRLSRVSEDVVTKGKAVQLGTVPRRPQATTTEGGSIQLSSRRRV